MSKVTISIDGLTLDELGRVTLSELALDRFEGDGQSFFAGGSDMGCPQTNSSCTNGQCSGSINSVCTNTVCDGASNTLYCRQEVGGG